MFTSNIHYAYKKDKKQQNEKRRIHMTCTYSS